MLKICWRSAVRDQQRDDPAMGAEVRAGCWEQPSAPIPHSQWHLDEMVVSIAGRNMYMWRAVDSEGEVLEVLVQSRRDKAVAVRLIKKLLKRHGLLPTVIVTD